MKVTMFAWYNQLACIFPSSLTRDLHIPAPRRCDRGDCIRDRIGSDNRAGDSRAKNNMAPERRSVRNMAASNTYRVDRRKAGRNSADNNGSAGSCSDTARNTDGLRKRKPDGRLTGTSSAAQP